MVKGRDTGGMHDFSNCIIQHRLNREQFLVITVTLFWRCWVEVCRTGIQQVIVRAQGRDTLS